ncbi:MAG: hypothetical protein HQK51_08130 [Oligoflexia bacterium]|nr:hypothetical protein [Oligoflexia bacterium]
MDMNTIRCNLCSSPMEITKILKHNKMFGIVFIVIGIFLSISLAGILLGIMFLVVGIIMCTKKKEIWYCSSCKTIINRVDRVNNAP